MNKGENKETTKGRFRWQIGTAIILLIAVAVYIIRLISAQPEEDYKNRKNSPNQISQLPLCSNTGRLPCLPDRLGTVTALRTVTVRSRVDGELIRVAFKEGQMVNAGDLLAEIDPRAFQVQLMQAEGQMLRDEALLNNAQTDLVRYKTLLEQDSIATQQTVTQESLVKQHRGT